MPADDSDEVSYKAGDVTLEYDVVAPDDILLVHVGVIGLIHH